MARLGRRAALAALWTALRSSRRGGPSLAERLLCLPRLLWATISGRYDGRLRVLGMLFAVGYLVSPVDLVPELIFSVFGLVDDSFVAVWLAGAVLSETERYLTWERMVRRPSHRGVRAGRPVR